MCAAWHCLVYIDTDIFSSELSHLYTCIINGFFYFNTLFGSLNYFGQNVLHLVSKQERERKKRKNCLSEMRYINRLRLKQDSLDVITWIKFKKISLWISSITLMNKLLTNSGAVLLYILYPYMELKYTSKLGSGKILNVLHSVLVSVR